MATDAENLAAAKSALLAALATQAGRPDYSIDGQSVNRSELLDRLDKLNAALAAAEGPFELQTEM